MEHISMKDIYQGGRVYSTDVTKTIYLTPEDRIIFDENKWIYHRMPSLQQWLSDIDTQLQMHHRQDSHHLSFTFPENIDLSDQFKAEINKKGFELGCLEMYAIHPNQLQYAEHPEITVKFVSHSDLEDYLQVYQVFAEPFGDTYVQHSSQMIRNTHDMDHVDRVVAYSNKKPVGILDLIITPKCVEIDGFGVIPEYQRRGIGTIMQSFVADVAQTKIVILVADGEDTAKDMYVKQGYSYIGFCQQVLKENV